ncbi:MAG TPA: aldo/keto reductase [Cytophagales bacterium]|jgi:predicted oxidoreductase
MPPVSRTPLPGSSDSLSRLILGAWRLADHAERTSPEAITGLVETSLAEGITTVDHADIYGNYAVEEIFGRALGGQSALRSRLELVSKCGIKLVSPKRPEHRLKTYDTSREHITQSVHNSLRNLRTDYLDVLLIHRPDPLMDADEMAEAFTALRQAGKVKHFGVSNFTPSQFSLIQSRLDFPLVTNQIEFSVLHLPPLYDGSLDQCQQLRVPPMAWSPLAGGKLFTNTDERSTKTGLALQKVGEELGGASVEQVALAWIMKHPANVMPVLGTGRPERIRESAGAASLQLSRDQWFEILAASAGQEVP